MKKLIRSILIAIIIFTGCTNTDHSQNPLYGQDAYKNFLYDLSSPDFIHKLHYDLREISGLTYSNGELICIQDESGTFFWLDITNGDIIRTVKFGKSSDYEGVELVGSTLLAINSKGDLFEVRDASINEESDKIETYLSSKNDVEGLGYDANKKQLLIACKGSPSIDDREFKGRAVYGFSLETEKLTTDPLFVITFKRVRDFLQSEKKVNFAPSAIAKSPIDGNYYILSSVSKLLLVVSEKGIISNILRLNPSIHRQPEGICFSPEGDLFIANEGGQSRARIVIYKPRYAKKN